MSNNQKGGVTLRKSEDGKENLLFFRVWYLIYEIPIDEKHELVDF